MHPSLSASRCRRLVAILCAASAPAALALPYPSNPYTTVGGAPPTSYCRSAVDSAGAYDSVDLESVGCISGDGPDAYADAVDGLYTDTDGLYASSGGGDSEARVEQAILMATGALVDLQLHRESGSGSSIGDGIQIWMENGGQEFTWAFDAALIARIEAGTIDLAYLTIKASTSYSLYAIPTGVYAGRYSTEGLLTNGTQQPAVSHIRFWTAVDYAQVSAPSAALLLGFALLALGARRHYRLASPIKAAARTNDRPALP